MFLQHVHDIPMSEFPTPQCSSHIAARSSIRMPALCIPAQRASPMSAQGNALGNRPVRTFSPNAAALIPRITFIQFKAMATAQGAKLILKRHAMVMQSLFFNVLSNLGDV